MEWVFKISLGILLVCLFLMWFTVELAKEYQLRNGKEELFSKIVAIVGILSTSIFVINLLIMMN